MKVSFKLEGDQQMVESLKARRERMQAAARQAVYVAGNAVMTEAKKRAPLDTGVLRASGYVKLPTAGNSPTVELGFGGAAGQYALIQHERTEYHHEVGEAKYLENAFHAVDVKAIITDTIKRAMDSNGSVTVSPGQHRTEPE